MTFGDQGVAVSVPSFAEVVDEACKQLMDRQIKYSIRRISQMEERLTGLEQELDAFLREKS
ncbi:MAG: hypothetical protein LBH16_10470 [Treponema sp.]|jgi:hypothetical protein|nr:hypothetical protein [Treponema sp.]